MKFLAKILALVMIVSSVLCLYSCKSGDENKKDDTKETQAAKDNETTGATEETTVETEETTVEDDTTAEDSVVEDTTEVTETETEAQTTIPETTVPVTTAPPETTAPVTQAPVTTVPPVTQAPETTVPVTQAPVTTTPPETQPPVETTTPGSQSEPYLEIPTIEGNSMVVNTASVPAGQVLYYDIYRVGGMILTINNANAYIICEGTRYDAQNGVLTFKVPAALASDAISFQIGNKGTAAATFKLVFVNETGSQANPVVLSAMGSTYTVSLEAGDSDGYNYKYVAEKAGTIRFYLSATTSSTLSVTNNRNSAQRNTDADAMSDANGTYIEIQVNAGDELVIVIGAHPNARGKYPAVTITWSGKFI